MKADSFYFCDSKIDVKIRQAQFRERCGLNVQQMYGRFVMDSLKLQLPDLCLRTPSSTLQTMVDMDMNAFADSAPGKLTAMIRGSIGREDLMLLPVHTCLKDASELALLSYGGCRYSKGKHAAS